MATVTESDDTVEYEDFIDDQIARTSFHVKTVDLVSGLILLGLVVAGMLFALVLVDHWIVGLGTVARIAGFSAVLFSALAVLLMRVIPPFIRSVNPEYSAQSVEHAFPSLNNSVINYLFFRDRPEQVRESVFQGMERQAADGLSEVPIDLAVDRSQIIYWGYGLVAITTLWVGYLLLSPKDPLQTIRRVAMPWKDIQRPSQVDILEVTPGNVDVFRGQTVQVTARVGGLKEGDTPVIEYSTLDGQFVDRRIAMQSDAGAGYFSGILSSSAGGVQQDLNYHILAGDAVSREFQVRAIEAPHIIVDRVEYDYPDYTLQPDVVMEGEGDIRAIEGTRITVHGRANQAIRRGHVELLPWVDAGQADNARSKTASLTTNDNMGHVRFTLRMDAKRKYPVYRGYRLHFMNDEDLASVDPIEHSIEVIPDLQPIVQILTPDKRTIEIPENGWQRIEVRAVDPDFQLTKVQVAARTRGRALFKKSLYQAKLANAGHQGQFVDAINFVPKDYGLRDGDVVEYLAVAEDNRHSPLQNSLQANRTITAKQYIRIVAADDSVSSPPNESMPEDAARDDAVRDDGSEQNDDGADEGADDQGESDNANGEQSQGESGDSGQTGDQPNGDAAQEPQSGDGSPEDQSQGDGETSEGSPQQQEGGSQGESGMQSGDSGESSGVSDQQSDSDSGQIGKPSGDKPESGNPGGEQATEPQDSDASSSAGDAGGAGDANDNASPQDAQDPSQGDRGARPDEPLPSSGERDGEVIERIRQHMQDKGELENYSGDDQNSDSDSGNDAGNDSETDSGDAPTGDGESSAESGSSENSNNPTSPETSQGESAQGNQEQGNQEQGNPDQENPDSKTSDPGKGDTDGSSETGSSDTTQENANPSQDPGAGNQPKDDSANEGAGDAGSDGVPSDQTGAPGDKGERHTDAASQADKPGPSPPDGQPKSESSQQESADSGQPNSEQPQEGSAGSERTEGGGDAADNPDSTGADTADGSQGDGTNEGTGDNTDSGDAEQGNSNEGSEQGGDSSSQNKSDGNSASDSSQNSDSVDGGKPGEGDPADGKTPDANRSGDKSGQPRKSTGTSSSGSSSSQSGSADGGAGDSASGPTGDDANLEYAREATDLVLEYLKDQQGRPDQELLDKLGWKPEDVQRFLRRWDTMKQNAQSGASGDAKGERQLDEVFRGMGLQAPGNQLREGGKQKDLQRNNRNTGRRTRVPSTLLDPFRAFQRALQQKN